MHVEALDFLQDLAIVMIVAGVVTVLFHRLRQPVVLGYLLAGLIIGPHMLPVSPIGDEQSIRTLADIGVIFLMFSLGLHFSLRRVAQVGPPALIAAPLEVGLMFLSGFGIGRAFGWSTVDCLFTGAILSISSTTIITKTLADLGCMKEKFAGLIFGILIVEDVIAVSMLALLSGASATGAEALEMSQMVITLGRLLIFLVVLIVVGLLAVPWLLRYLAQFRSNELLLIAALGMCFGVSLLAARLQYSVALGAFIIGAVMAEAREAGRIQTLIEPLRDMFSAVFFVAVGMLIEPRLLRDYALPIGVCTLAVIVGKIIGASAGAFVAGNDRRTSLRVGMGLAQIGEFSFIIASLGLTLGTSSFIYPLAVSVSILTTLLTPYLIRNTDRAVGVFERLAPRTFIAFLDTYEQWTRDLRRAPRGGNQVRALLRKWALQIGLNMALVSGIFIAAKSFAVWAERRGPVLPGGIGASRAIAWLAGMLVALPLLVATLRKMRAVAQVLAEMSVPRTGTGEQTRALRGLIANAIFLAAALAMGVVVLGISAALLPPWPVLAALLALITVITVWRWNTFVKMYARAQIALRATLTQSHAAEVEPQPRAILPLLRNAIVETVDITSASPAAGKLIRELALRTRTGASAVGIERNGTSIINPGPDEELLPGDRVLLLGDPAQLNAARTLLSPSTPSATSGRDEPR